MLFSILFVVILIVDYYSVSVSVQDDGAILVQHDGFTWETWSVLFIGIGLVATVLIARWWTFRWWIENDAIWTSGGIFNAWRRRVTFGKIVTVDRSSNPVRRVFNASRIAIETTAVDQAAPDILFGYLSNTHANLLEELLIGQLVFDGEDTKSRRFEPLSVDRIGWWDLILAGATTFQFGRAVVILYAVAVFILVQLSPTIVIAIDISTIGRPAVQFVVAPLLAIVVVLWLVSTGFFVMSFARFRLSKHADWLVLETGVIRHSRRLIKTGAIQGLEISRSPLQRYFRAKRAMLRMRLPAYGAPPVHAMVLHPAVTATSLPALTYQIVGMDLATSEAMCGNGIQPLAGESRKSYITYWPLRIAAGSAVLLASLLVLRPQLWWLAILPMILVVPFALSGWLAWRGVGWYAERGEWLLLQRGAFILTMTAAKIDRIQYVSWSEGLFARASATCTLAISVATSGGAGLVNQLLSVLGRPVNPSLIRIRAVDTTSAAKIAVSTGFERSLPPALTSNRVQSGSRRS